MKSKSTCKMFQLHFCKVGTCILQTIQICEEQWTCIHVAKDIQTRSHIENGFLLWTFDEFGQWNNW
jgi:hypothetical protein